MDANRTFEQTDMTKIFLKALKEASESLTQVNHLVRSIKLRDEVNEYLKLISKIEEEKLDVRLVSRED